MKQLIKIFIFFMFFCCATSVYAIEWVELTSPRGKTVYVDKDSIKEYKGYYFYNIKFNKENSDKILVLTMQSGVKHQFSARLKLYSPKEYESLKGDYENITNNLTTNLEMVTYDSIVNTCYRYVKQVTKNDILPTIELK